MATLRLRKAMAVSAINTLADAQTYGPAAWLYHVKIALVAAGWVVYRSATGTVMADSDLWTSSSFLTMWLQHARTTASTTATVDGVWCCLRSPSVDSNGDYLHICLSPADSVWSTDTAKGTSNALQVYGQFAKWSNNYSSSHPGYYGYYHGACRIGMALSSSATAFTGGTTNSSASASIPANGSRPSAANVVWSIFPIGSGYEGSSKFSYLTVVTEGNQFHIYQHGSTSTALQQVASVVAMQNGGYGFLQSEISADGAWDTYGGLHGGRYWATGRTGGPSATNYKSGPECPYVSYFSLDHTVYIKRLSATSIITGALANPIPAGVDTWTLSQFIAGNLPLAKLSYLYALSASDPSNFDLGPFSDFFMITSPPATHQLLLHYSDSTWFTVQMRDFFALKWDTSDVPTSYSTVTP